MKRALASMSCLVLSAASLASGCVDDNPKKAVLPSSAPGELCGQTGRGKAAGGKDLFTFEVIRSFEDTDPVPTPGLLVIDDDETADGDGVKCRTTFDADGNEINTKETYSQNGDGVVGFKPLAPAGGEADPLAQCQSLTGAENTTALNIWGPFSTVRTETGVKTREGYNFGGGTVAVAQGEGAVVEPVGNSWNRGGVIDASSFKGIALWARQASPEEAVPASEGTSPDPSAGGAVGVEGQPQRGTSRLMVMVQTVQTAAIDVTYGLPPLQAAVEAGYDIDLPKTPCVDYDPWLCKQPVGTQTWGEGGTHQVAFRDQCWDGFRTELEITNEWRFYMLPFSQMRQAGWGRIAEEFETGQIRSISLSGSVNQPMNILVDEIAFYR